MIEVRVPDIGDFDQVDVVEVLVTPGKRVEADESLITLESEKASMDVPSPSAGVIKEIAVKVGDKVGEGDLIVKIEVEGEEGKEEEAAAPAAAEKPKQAAQAKEASAEQEAKPAKKEAAQKKAAQKAEPAEEISEKEPAELSRPEESAKGTAPQEVDAAPAKKARAAPPPESAEPTPEAGPAAHASPSVRQFARDLGVDVSKVTGSGPKGRILREDVQAYVKRAMTSGSAPSAGGRGEAAAPAGGGIPAIPAVDFARFGEIEEVPLSRIRQRAKENLHRSWLNVPHVTQHELADITELEAFRRANAEDASKRGFKLTLLAFLMKAAVATLEEYPRVNASLAPSGTALVYKKYWHLGIAVDTEDGLVVPVIRDVDRKSVYDLAKELGEVSARAREGKLKMDEVLGATFTITSLGGIGGTSFTPIVNAPEVAILGVSRSRTEAVWRDGQFVPRLMLPLSLSYDHRVVDGAEAARFTTYLAAILGDIRRLIL
jgi:pyruvate dehydrogenase E2 component (dihydrolipoamide acetyltransferase)